MHSSSTVSRVVVGLGKEDRYQRNHSLELVVACLFVCVYLCVGSKNEFNRCENGNFCSSMNLLMYWRTNVLLCFSEKLSLSRQIFCQEMMMVILVHGGGGIVILAMMIIMLLVVPSSCSALLLLLSPPGLSARLTSHSSSSAASAAVTTSYASSSSLYHVATKTSTMTSSRRYRQQRRRQSSSSLLLSGYFSGNNNNNDVTNFNDYRPPPLPSSLNNLFHDIKKAATQATTLLGPLGRLLDNGDGGEGGYGGRGGTRNNNNSYNNEYDDIGGYTKNGFVEGLKRGLLLNSSIAGTVQQQPQQSHDFEQRRQWHTNDSDYNDYNDESYNYNYDDHDWQYYDARHVNNGYDQEYYSPSSLLSSLSLRSSSNLRSSSSSSSCSPPPSKRRVRRSNINDYYNNDNKNIVHNGGGMIFGSKSLFEKEKRYREGIPPLSTTPSRSSFLSEILPDTKRISATSFKYDNNNNDVQKR